VGDQESYLANEVIAMGGQANTTPKEGREQLLRTKLFIPPIRSNRVPRPRLMEQVNRGLDKAIILVSAPAGYGKTTLVSSWLRETGIPSAWLSLDEGDNDPIQFLQYFITALHQIVPAIQMDLLGILQGMQPAPFEALINIIINEIVEQAAPLILVLDDFHTLQAQPVLDICTYLIEHIPPQLHLALLTRTDPPLPLSRLRALNQLVDLRAEQLRFTQEEIAYFLNNMMRLDLSSEDIAAMEARTEGWIASLQLAAYTMQGGEDVHRFISAFTGSNTYIMDYLIEEVFSRQTERVGIFLMQTSILDRMCGPLCNAVAGQDPLDTSDGQVMLETLAQRNLFLFPLDDKRQWYRYHHLFADVLNRRLEQFYPQQAPGLHQRASQWFEQNGFIYDAIHHALKCGEQERAALLVAQNGCDLLMRGEVVNLLGWIKPVEAFSQAFPWIAIQKGWALALTGQLDQAEASLQTVERILASMGPSDEVGTMSGMVYAARAYRANMQGRPREAANFARRALSCLPMNNDFSCSLGSVATSILGDASWMSGTLLDARRAYTEAVQISQAASNLHMFIIANSHLADVLMELGQLHQAARMYIETIQAATLPEGQISPLAERDYAGLGLAYYELNRLDDSAENVRQCLELSQRWGSIEYLAIGDVMMARLYHVQGNTKKAQETLNAAEQLVNGYAITPWHSVWIKSAVARLWIAEGNSQRAFDLAKNSGITSDDLTRVGEIPYHLEPLYLILVRFYLIRGDNDLALALSEPLGQRLVDAGRVRMVIENLLLQSLAYQGKKDIDQALTVLGKALALAQPEGYIRVFLDEGEPMKKLLFQAKSHRIGSGFASDLLAAWGGASAAEKPSAQPLIEPLTLRELEVLMLIEAGLSNQGIADKLVISMPTVKRHISNIYTKLGAESRTQAVSIGRELKLVE
jgi:LuxR family maltose regulon positive regulatory protein